MSVLQASLVYTVHAWRRCGVLAKDCVQSTLFEVVQCHEKHLKEGDRPLMTCTSSLRTVWLST